MNKANEYLKEIDNVIANGKFKDNWESLSAFKTPSWYREGRFGIFIHWGYTLFLPIIMNGIHA